MCIFFLLLWFPLLSIGASDPRIVEADKLYKQAAGLDKAGRLSEAIPLVRRALELREEVFGPESLETAQGLNDLGYFLSMTGDYANARKFLERGLAIREKVLGPNDAKVGFILLKLGTIAAEQGDFATARKAFERSLSIMEHSFGPEHPNVADLVLNLGSLAATEGDYAAARILDERSLRIREKALGPDHPLVAQTLGGLGIVLVEGGDFKAARAAFERALQIYEKALPPEHPDIAQALNDLATLLGRQGDHATARQMFERSLKIREKAYGPVHIEVAQSLNNLSNEADAFGDYASARVLLERAAKMVEQIFGPDNFQFATTLNHLGEFLLRHKDYATARPYVERALAIREKALGPWHPDVARSLDLLAGTLIGQGDIKSATPMLARSLGILEKALGKNNPDIASTLNNLANCEWKEGNLAGTRQCILRAATVVNAHVTRTLPTLSLAEQRSFVDSTISYDGSLLLSTHRGRESLAAAYGFLFRWKGLLIDSLRRQTAIARLARDPKYRKPVERLQAIRAQIAGWYHKAGTVSREEWNRKNDALTGEKESIERELAQALPPGALSDALAETTDWKKAFGSVLKADEAFVDIYRYAFWDKGEFVEIRYAAIVTGPTGDAKLVDFGRMDAVQQVLRDWRAAVLDGGEASSEWQALASRVWKPLADVIPKNARKIWVSPDGELARLPWQLLPASNPQTKDALVSQTDSARELARLRRAMPPKRGEPSWLLAGGIDFGSVTKNGDRSGETFAPLPGTETEVRTLQRLAQERKMPVTLLTGKQASKDTVASQLAHASFAHLATHGFFYREVEVSVPPKDAALRVAAIEENSEQIKSVRNPLVESGLALAGANTREDAMTEALGLLTAEELVGLDLSRCELVALSACDTGRGEEITGQGVMGLRASVMAAGTRSLLMSLWKVPDEPTVKLMGTFYTNLWVKKLPKAEALLRAQETVRTDPRFALPRNWAGWVLAGEGW